MRPTIRSPSGRSGWRICSRMRSHPRPTSGCLASGRVAPAGRVERRPNSMRALSALCVEPRNALTMTRHALADRFVNYGDAVVAFGMMNALAFLIALSEPEVRCSLRRGGAFFILIFPITASFLSAGIFACRRAEVRLRDGETLESPVSRYLQYAYLVRQALIWFGMTLTLGLALVATRDPSCAG